MCVSECGVCKCECSTHGGLKRASERPEPESFDWGDGRTHVLSKSSVHLIQRAISEVPLTIPNITVSVNDKFWVIL